MKKFMVTILAAILGSMGYIVVDQSIEDRMAVLEEQVSQLKEQNSVLEEQHSAFMEQHSEFYSQIDGISSDIDEAHKEINGLNTKYDEYKSSHTKLIYPTGFQSRLKPVIYKMSYGEYYADFDITKHKIQGGKTVYISPDGDDSNPGTKDAPKRTFKSAFSDKSCTTLYLFEGTYIVGEHYSGTLDIAGKNIIGIGKVYLKNASQTASGYLRTTGTAYLENLDISGGDRSFYAKLTDNEYLYFNNCRFHDTAAGNAVTVVGGNSYLVECAAYNAYLDGFNYHKNTEENSIPCAVEINCKAYDNGNSSNNSCNGSTVHDGASIIRIGGEYYGCHGGNVADTGTDEATLSYSLNLGVYAHDSTQSLTEYKHFNSCFWVRYAKMWLYDCKASSSTYSITSINHSTVYSTGFNSDKVFDENANFTDNTSTVTVA